MVQQRGRPEVRNSPLSKAIGYATGQKNILGSFLLDGQILISNNLDENAIRPFVMGRKNWLFCNTPNGAAASAAVYSIVETAKANGLDPYQYLKYLLERIPRANGRYSHELLDSLMPWNAEMQIVHENNSIFHIGRVCIVRTLPVFSP